MRHPLHPSLLVQITKCDYMDQLKRHQTKIKFIKYVFLSSGIFLLLVILVTIMYSPNSSNTSSSQQEINDKKPYLTKDYSLSIQSPVFEGFSNNLTPYKILANTMMRDKNNNYILQTVSGKYLTSDGDITIKSKNAALDEITKQVVLTDDVLIIFNGAQLKSSQLNFNINTQNINSETPVIVDFSNSYIKADKLESEGYSDSIKFKGNVESVFDIDDF